jgi:hypothetical protein
MTKLTGYGSYAVYGRKARNTALEEARCVIGLEKWDFSYSLGMLRSFSYFDFPTLEGEESEPGA